MTENDPAHTHTWAVDHFHAGFGCSSCGASYWDWSRAEIAQLQRELRAVLAERDLDDAEC